MAVNASVSVSTYATVTQSELGNMTGRKGITHDVKLADVTKVHAKSYTGTQSLDMTSGLVDPFGAEVTFSAVKAIHVKNRHEATSLVVNGTLVGTDQYTVGPGKCLYIDTARTVDGSHNFLSLTGTAVPFDVIILGS